MQIFPLKTFYRRHERWMPIYFFLAGFLFDVVTLSRIDDPVSIGQQALYLTLIGGILAYEFLFEANRFQPGFGFVKIWRYREPILHFILGSLLSIYSLYYFKSASVLTSFGFVGVLTVLLVINEFMRFGRSQKVVHMALFSLCLISFFIAIVPITLGFIGLVPFLGSVLVSAGCFWVMFRFLRKRLAADFPKLRRQLVLPFLGVELLFSTLYFFRAIPPVPLSTSYIGFFHNIEREGDSFKLYSTRPWYRFWESGDQTFYARPGDRIYCFARLFAPTGFKDEMIVRWLYRDRRGWQTSDAIPMPFVGGRAEGYRGVTYKSNYSPGKWRVQIETTDGREVGRLRLNIIADDSKDPRQTRIDTH